MSSERLSNLAKVTKLEPGEGFKPSAHFLWLGQNQCNYDLLHWGIVCKLSAERLHTQEFMGQPDRQP